MYNNLNEELFAFIKKSPTSFHAIAAMEVKGRRHLLCDKK